MEHPEDTSERTQSPMLMTYEFIQNWLRARFANTDRGASLVEYALLVALIAILCIAAVTLLGDDNNSSGN